ncbi:sigma-70 family RNA polymerase sigma factor [Oerskovia enterophila]|uniref:ECF RNA polymerase sigma factor SigG n=1 Tax=Oerskovia enterophila TaxID=43678 RepID=A0A163R0P8_9CELL|nr:sigma-70 family RNA polymerase sigma factor [Oerskovia enterophila]KZM34733.1 ECF RNA polymerase sigma factor SigG [Oerskovia enterophila]
MTERTATVADEDLGELLDQYRSQLTGYCYRLLGSSFEADDAVQDTMVRAWRSYDRFEGRSALRSWLYRIATNVCFDHLAQRKRRERPMGLGAAQSAEERNLGEQLSEETWVEPIPDDRVLPRDGDPADVAVGRESIRLAFVAALQYLPPKQRAVLILREVLRWQASEVAELLETSVPSVNSALQRARATLSAQAHYGSGPGTDGVNLPTVPADDVKNELLEKYLDAFERYDMPALVALLHDEATLSMPPYALWMQGPVEIEKWMVGPGAECRGSRMVPVQANGTFGFGQYRVSPDGGYDAWALQVIDTVDGKVTGINAFLDVEAWYPLFGLPLHLDA